MEENENFKFKLPPGRYLTTGVSVYEYVDDEGTSYLRVDYLGSGHSSAHTLGLLQAAVERQKSIVNSIWE